MIIFLGLAALAIAFAAASYASNALIDQFDHRKSNKD